MTEVSQIRSTAPTASPSATSSIVGIWRVGKTIHQSDLAELSLAQPADAAGSPRWDYAIKQATHNNVEATRQIGHFVAAASAVMHPNLVPILDASIEATNPYLLMPRLEGQTMQAELWGSKKKLPVALWLVRQTAQALEALHTAGWVHGDIKPDNVMIGPRGHVTVLDLGFATRVHTINTGHYRGTPDYSAPESLIGNHAALPAMDVFSLGRMLWQWMACIEPVSQSVLEPVATLIEQMISLDPEQRPAANRIVKELLKLEIETLGQHIGPVSTPLRRAA